jgi:hypothetical protein
MDAAEASPPLVASAAPERTEAPRTPRVAGHPAEIEVLVTATVWAANLDDW